MKRFFLCFATTVVCTLIAIAQTTKSISSPNGQVVLNIGLTDKGEPTYKLDYKNKAVIKPSKLGLELKQGTSLLKGFTISKTATSTFD